MSIVTVVHIIVSILLILVVLLQQGKGADVGSTFGGGGQSVFGAAGADNLLTRFTTFVAAIFMVTSVMLALRTQDKLTSDGELFKNTPAAAVVQQEVGVETTPAAEVEEEAQPVSEDSTVVEPQEPVEPN